ncbi:MAG: hypothetical protein ACD_20C00051G0010 [uncultured bacterium]|nr:MAG: hypothetical protein ACD_20C00051G0010 [uncultured bacterium]
MGLELLDTKLKDIAGFLGILSRQIDITVQDIKIDNLETSLNGLLIAQISDLHINEWHMEIVEQAISILNKLNPDIVVMTGDAICNGQKFIPDLTRLFKEINPKYGKFACIGNHDHSDGDNGRRIQELYRKTDFKLLVNESVKVNIQGETLYIAGADDIELGDQNIIKMVKDLPKEATSIFLTHNPFNFQDFAQFNPNLVLAGHTHGGQLYFSMLKFIYNLRLGCNYISGLYNLDQTNLYVNRGIGTALIAPKIFNKEFIINTPRINSKPEISLFRLISGD